MQEGQLLMTQADRDRLVTLKKAKKKLITQRAAAEELGLSTRQVKRQLYAMKKRGDKAVIHGLRGKPSKRRIEESIKQEAVKILSAEVYWGFGPTLAAEYLRKKHGIKASMFRTAEKRKRDEPGVDKDPVEMPPTQIGRGLRELGITWIPAHSPQAKGRVERNFQTAQDRLVKGMRVAGVKTIEEANQYLEQDYMVWWARELTVEASNPDNAHRPLDKSHNLAASLSHVETRQVENNYTIRVDAKLYQIERAAIVSGLRRATVRIEKRLDGTLAVRYGEKYLPVTQCAPAEKKAPAPSVQPTGKRRQAARGSDWNQKFDLKKAPKVWQAAQESGRRKSAAD